MTANAQGDGSLSFRYGNLPRGISSRLEGNVVIRLEILSSLSLPMACTNTRTQHERVCYLMCKLNDAVLETQNRNARRTRNILQGEFWID